jgi:DnaJ-class molecular chaperone
MKIPCPTCNGKGEAVFSCCTGEVIDSDIMMCPSCYEHLGEEECIDCNGSGEIEEDTETVDRASDPQLQAEIIADAIKYGE